MHNHSADSDARLTTLPRSSTSQRRFDAYHKWLGIPPQDQPPNHYRLLALCPFESDAEVIERAADQRMAHLKTFGVGNHSALSQGLLNEVSLAKVCLLHAKKKQAYDQSLRSRVPPRTPVSCPLCERWVENDPSLAGRTVACPYCNGHFAMPDANQTVPAPPAVRKQADGARLPSVSAYCYWRRRWRRHQETAFAVFLIAITFAMFAMIFFVGLGPFFVPSPEPPTEPTTGPTTGPSPGPSGTDPDGQNGDGPTEPKLPFGEAEFKDTLTAAWGAMRNRDLAGAASELKQAQGMVDAWDRLEGEGDSREYRKEVERLKLLHLRLAEFWRAFTRGLSGLQPVDEIMADGQPIAIVVDVADGQIIIRFAGKNLVFNMSSNQDHGPTPDMPRDLMMAIADRCLDESKPDHNVIRGAFHAVDAQGDPDEARRLWRDAAAAGVKNVDSLIPLLDDYAEDLDD